MKINKKKLAREWLIFIISIIFAIFILPWLLYPIIFISNDEFLGFTEIYSLWFESEVRILYVVPYIIIQFIRSIIWAIKNLK